MIMENRQLLYFTRIVELGSFTKAAAELRIAQPSLGQQVRNLEEELGTALLVRHSRGVKPTEAGAILFEHASRILEDVRWHDGRDQRFVHCKACRILQSELPGHSAQH